MSEVGGKNGRARILRSGQEDEAESQTETLPAADIACFFVAFLASKQRLQACPRVALEPGIDGAAIGDPLVPYEMRVENGMKRLLEGRSWTPKQRQWLIRIARALKVQPVGEPAILSDPLFAQHGGFEVVDLEFGNQLREVLMDLNAAIWDTQAA
jgi:hypothetical protein